MSKGEQTREMILSRAAQVFSRQGYFGSSLAEIMQETGLEKGGIYNHFGSKEQLALEAFDYAMARHDQRLRELFANKKHAMERLHALITYFQSLIEDPIVPGGCPILTTAVEADDAHPVLREKAREAMDRLRGTVIRVLNRGIERQELRPDIDVEATTSLIIASGEGAIMMSKLYQDPTHIRRVCMQLASYLERTLPLS